MKIVINSCYGGFSLSTKAVIELIKKNSECLTVHPIDSEIGKAWVKNGFEYAGEHDFLHVKRSYGMVVFEKNVYELVKAQANNFENCSKVDYMYEIADAIAKIGKTEL